MAAQKWTYGFSKQADSDGLVHVKAVDEFLATLPEAKRLKLPSRFVFEKVYRKATFPNANVKKKAYQNLSNRNFVIPGQGFIFEALELKYTEGTPKTDFNSPPEAHKDAATTWERVGIFTETHPAGAAWSWDWDPSVTSETVLAKVKAKAAEL